MKERFVVNCSRARAEPDGTRAETTFRLSPKRRITFKSAGESVQSTADSRGVRISVCNAGYTTFRGRVRVLATYSIRQFPLHFPSRASPCATTFLTQYNPHTGPLYPHRKKPRYPLNRRIGERFGEEKYPLSLLGADPSGRAD